MKISKPDVIDSMRNSRQGDSLQICLRLRKEESANRVCVERRASSVTRNLPKGLGWIIGAMIDKLPGQSLTAAIEATRRAQTAESPAMIP